MKHDIAMLDTAVCRQADELRMELSKIRGLRARIAEDQRKIRDDRVRIEQAIAELRVLVHGARLGQ